MLYYTTSRLPNPPHHYLSQDRMRVGRHCYKHTSAGWGKQPRQPGNLQCGSTSSGVFQQVLMP
jgi:hypothetical protein